MRKLFQNASVGFTSALLTGSTFVSTAFAADPPAYDPTSTGQFQQHLPAVTKTQGDVGLLITNIINFGMGFLGLIAVLIIIKAGFQLLTAGGSDDAIKDAKKLLTQAIVGLIIIMASWGIASWLVTVVGTNIVAS